MKWFSDKVEHTDSIIPCEIYIKNFHFTVSLLWDLFSRELCWKILTNKNTIEEISLEDIKSIKYNQIEREDEWNVKFFREVTDIKFNQVEVEIFSKEELDEILTYLCTT